MMNKRIGVVAASAVLALVALIGQAQALSTLDVAVSPASATNMVSSVHTVTATVTDAAGTPVEGAVVLFSFTGSNVAAPCTQGSNFQTTGADGTAQCSYEGTVPGEDTITAAATLVDADGTLVAAGSSTASKTWVNPAIDLTPSADTNPVGTSHTVTATVSVPSGAGGSLDSAKVTFSVAGVNPQAATEVATTSGGGGTRVATFTYTGNNVGHDDITATVTQVNGLTTTGGTDTATKEWIPAITVTKENGATSRTAAVVYDWSVSKVITSGPTPGTVAPGSSATVGYRLTPTRTEVARVTLGHVTTSVCVTNSGPSAITGTVSDTVFFNNVARATSSKTGVTIPSGQNATCTSITVDFGANSGETSFTNVASFTPDGSVPVSSTIHTFTIPATATVDGVTDANASLTDSCTLTVQASCGPPSGATFPISLTGADSGVAINYTRQITNVGACSPATISATNTATLFESDTGQARTAFATAIVAATPCLTATVSVAVDRRFVYDWTVAKSTPAGVHTVGLNEAIIISYTVTATRTKTGEQDTASGEVCVHNASSTDAATGVSVTAQVETDANVLVPGQTPFASSGNSIPAQSTLCLPYSIPFAPTGAASYHVRATISSGSTTLQATSPDFRLPAFATSAEDSTATVTDTPQVCPVSFTCDMTPQVFAFPRPGDHPDSPHFSSAPYTGSVTYTRRVASNGRCGAGSVDNLATLVEDDTGASRQATATTVVATTCITATKTATATRTITKTYDWTLAKSATPAAASLPAGSSTTIGYTLAASRSLASQTDLIRVTGNICVQNTLATSTTVTTIVDQVEQQGTAGWAAVPGATQTIAPADPIPAGGERCYPYDIGFAAPSDLSSPFRNHATVTAGAGPADAIAAFTLPAATAVEKDASATVDDAASCPAGYTCGAPSIAFPQTLSGDKTISYTRTVANKTACGAASTLGNTATLTEADSSQTRTASASVMLSPGPCEADLAITKTASPSPATSGGDVTYTLQVTNNGPAAATGVTVTDELPAGTTFGSASASQGSCTQAGGTVTCNLGGLASGASATVTIVVHTSFLPETLTNTATVSGNEPDLHPGNNTATTSTQLVFVSNECKVTGGGKLPDGSNFGLEAKGTPKVDGHVNYVDHMGVHLDSTAVTGVRCAGKSAVILGTARVNGASVTFLVQVTDNDEPGRTDTFGIAWPGYADGGTLAGGNIQVH